MTPIYLLALLCAVVSSAQAASWFAATNGTSAGKGSISDPWDLQTAGTSTAIQAGDVVWLRGGTYVPVGTNHLWNPYLHDRAGFCISPGKSTYNSDGGLGTNRITFSSYSNEWAAIDRPLLIACSICFKKLEFFDSQKGLGRAVSPSIATTNGIVWTHFTCGTNCEWDNCLIHDIDNGWGDACGTQIIRDSIIWYLGWTIW